LSIICIPYEPFRKRFPKTKIGKLLNKGDYIYFIMADKCLLCSEKIEKDYLRKLNGTIIKLKKNTSDRIGYVCSSCQKEHNKPLKKA